MIGIHRGKYVRQRIAFAGRSQTRTGGATHCGIRARWGRTRRKMSIAAINRRIGGSSAGAIRLRSDR